MPRLLLVLSKEVGWPRASTAVARVGGWCSCHWRRLWRGLSMRPRAILSILACTCSAQSVQAGGRRVGEDTGGPIYLSHQGAWLDMPRSGPGWA